uniref:C-type lectin domain-containing protein n=1 Tax=Crocodylus porosus TaxID=8502 RepID=A0A7M4E662_CROPO
MGRLTVAVLLMMQSCIELQLAVFRVLSLCSPGWLAFKGSCYKISRESKPWGMAQQICELSSLGAHLVDIKTEEENERLRTSLPQKFLYFAP